MLKMAGESASGGCREVIESLTFDPDLMATGDLEPGTATIAPTSRPAIGSAQYSASLTLAKPLDARIAVKRIVARLSVNIASLGTATHLYCSVRVDVDDASHELFSEDWTSTGLKLDAVDVHSGNKAPILGLLSDGGAHTLYFLFWANAAGQAQVDAVSAWEGVGSCDTGGASYCIEVAHSGLISISDKIAVLGSGTVNQCAFADSNTIGRRFRGVTTTQELSMADNTGLVGAKAILSVFGTVATDLNYLDYLSVVLRSEK
jgi:hypothetical protein